MAICVLGTAIVPTEPRVIMSTDGAQTIFVTRVGRVYHVTEVRIMLFFFSCQ